LVYSRHRYRGRRAGNRPARVTSSPQEGPYDRNRAAGGDGVARPNILLIVTDEERSDIPRPDGYALPARERLAASGVTFENCYGASVQCSSARSVMYTGQHVPITQIFDNDNMPYIRPLDPALGTVGTMLQRAGYYCTYQGKWHLSNAYVDPANPAPIGSRSHPNHPRDGGTRG
jgi:arylsulfatase